MLLGIAIAAMAALFGINATDEELSEQARAALQVPAPPPPSEDNGFVDFLVLGAPLEAPTYATGLKVLASYRDAAAKPWAAYGSIGLDHGMRRCLDAGYLACAASSASRLTELIDSHAVFLARHHAMREKPKFIDLFADLDPDTPLPSLANGADSSRLALAAAALRFQSGKYESAISELEAEYDFYRKVAEGSRTLIQKMWAFARLDATGLFAAEIARHLPAGKRALWPRLEKVLRAPAAAELDITPAWNEALAETARWMSTRQYARMPDAVYEVSKMFGVPRTRPWWDAASPWLYRPHYSVNRYVAKAKIMQETGALSAKDFLAALPQYRARAAALEPTGLERWVLSPAGHGHDFLSYYDASDYFGRAHGHAAVQRLIALQVRLRAAGVTAPPEVARALSGALGQAYLNPFTGNPMDFDRERGTIGFPCDVKYLTGPARELLMKDGRVELAL